MSDISTLRKAESTLAESLCTVKQAQQETSLSLSTLYSLVRLARDEGNSEALRYVYVPHSDILQPLLYRDMLQELKNRVRVRPVLSDNSSVVLELARLLKALGYRIETQSRLIDVCNALGLDPNEESQALLVALEAKLLQIKNRLADIVR